MRSATTSSSRRFRSGFQQGEWQAGDDARALLQAVQHKADAEPLDAVSHASNADAAVGRRIEARRDADPVIGDPQHQSAALLRDRNADRLRTSMAVNVGQSFLR